MLAKNPDPNEPVVCNACAWHGRIKDCNPQPNALVECPRCKQPVVAGVSEDGGFVIPKCLESALLDMLVQPNEIVEK